MFVIYTQYKGISGFAHNHVNGVPTAYLSLARRFDTADDAHEYLKNNTLHEAAYTLMEIVEEMK